ncbi:galactose-1-epimerase [Cohnella sp. CFH 77786]|nr:galactose-1-epimerase [Cohnella sp. CFH 77786]
MLTWPCHSFADSGSITKERFGQTADGQPLYLYTLKNAHGMRAAIMNYGGIMYSLHVPDRRGVLEDVLLGYANPMDYLTTGNKPYFGALIGRYANRIADGRLTLNGTLYRLSVNEGRNTLHGGIRGFDKRIWDTEPVVGKGQVGLLLRYVSNDGEEGFPGKVTATVVYTLTDANELRIDYSAVTDKETVVNLSQHNYYNLKGAGNGDILDHRLTLRADRFTPVRTDYIPTGEIRSVTGTDMDFRRPTVIGSRIRSNDPQIRLAEGFDHNYVLNPSGSRMKHAATVFEPVSGRRLDAYTTQPGVHLYTGNHLTQGGAIIGKGGKSYGNYYGFCLETQHFPDSPHHPNFPSTVLKPGQVYKQTAIFKFSVVK